MGQASGKPSAIKENVILNMKHKEIMGQFREGICNLLVATSVLEEGIDVPACNLIVRFDRIKTYCDYVQTKGNKSGCTNPDGEQMIIFESTSIRSGKIYQSFLLHFSK